MMVYTRQRHGKRSVIVVNSTPCEAELLIDAIRSCGNSKYFVKEIEKK